MEIWKPVSHLYKEGKLKVIETLYLPTEVEGDVPDTYLENILQYSREHKNVVTISWESSNEQHHLNPSE